MLGVARGLTMASIDH
jgi:hypothetical protein